MCFKMAFQHLQHRRVAVINGGTCNWDRSIVLAAETLRKQSHATGTGSVARSYKEAG